MKKKKMKFNKLNRQFYNYKKIMNKKLRIQNTLKKIILSNKMNSKNNFKIMKKNYV